jgi:lysine 6-dehydrogenase
MRVLALGGAGAVCSEATRDLAAYSDFDEIVIGELDVAAGEDLAEDIGDSRVTVQRVDASNVAALPGLFSEFDVIMNGLPFKFDVAVTRAAVEAGVPGLDLGAEEEQYAYNAEARRKGITFVTAFGATPGTTNMMAQYGAEKLDTVESIEVNFAAFRCLAPSPGLLTTTFWEFHPAEQKRAYFADGSFHRVMPMSGPQEVVFAGPIGAQLCYYVPHGETYSFAESYAAKGIRRVETRGCFPPHVMRLIAALLESGFVSDESIAIDGWQTTPLDAVTRLLFELPESKQNLLWAYGLVVSLSGTRDGRDVTLRYQNAHPPMEDWGGPAAYYKNVGIPLSIGAQMLARGEVLDSGVLPPERAFRAERVFTELARRGIEIHEQIEDTGRVSAYGEWRDADQR